MASYRKHPTDLLSNQCTGLYAMTILILKLPTLCVSESCIKIKINKNFYFCISVWCLKIFYEGFYEGFLVHQKAPKRSIKMKNKIKTF